MRPVAEFGRAPVTYRHTKKVKAFRENLNSPARSALGPIPKANPNAAAKPKPKPKSTKPVVHRAPRRKPSVMDRVRQNCHQVVPPAALEFAGIVPTPVMSSKRLPTATT